MISSVFYAALLHTPKTFNLKQFVDPCELIALFSNLLIRKPGTKRIEGKINLNEAQTFLLEALVNALEMHLAICHGSN